MIGRSINQFIPNSKTTQSTTKITLSRKQKELLETNKHMTLNELKYVLRGVKGKKATGNQCELAHRLMVLGYKYNPSAVAGDDGQKQSLSRVLSSQREDNNAPLLETVEIKMDPMTEDGTILLNKSS